VKKSTTVEMVIGEIEDAVKQAAGVEWGDTTSVIFHHDSGGGLTGATVTYTRMVTDPAKGRPPSPPPPGCE